MSTPTSSSSTGAGERGGAKAAQDAISQGKIADKKMKLAKYGMKFQSAGTLISIGDRIERDTPIVKTTPTQAGDRNKTTPTQTGDRNKTTPTPAGGRNKTTPTSRNKTTPIPAGDDKGNGEVAVVITPRAMTSLQQRKASYTTRKWEKAGAAKEREFKPSLPEVDAPPPPLMSRQRELTMEKYEDRTSDEEDDFTTAKTAIKKVTKFKFNIAK